MHLKGRGKYSCFLLGNVCLVCMPGCICPNPVNSRTYVHTTVFLTCTAIGDVRFSASFDCPPDLSSSHSHPPLLPSSFLSPYTLLQILP
jgi:hypothetical protein